MAIHPHSPSLPPAGGENMAVGLALIRDGLDRLAAVDSTSVGDDVVVGVWEELERLSRSQSAVSAVLLAEIDKRGMQGRSATATLRCWAGYTATPGFGV